MGSHVGVAVQLSLLHVSQNLLFVSRFCEYAGTGHMVGPSYNVSDAQNCMVSMYSGLSVLHTNQFPGDCVSSAQ